MVRPFLTLTVIVAAALLFVPGGTLVVGYTLAALSLGVIAFLMARGLYTSIDNWRLGRFPSSTRPAERRHDGATDTREAA
jgi:hypothetical protein